MKKDKIIPIAIIATGVVIAGIVGGVRIYGAHKNHEQLEVQQEINTINTEIQAKNFKEAEANINKLKAEKNPEVAQLEQQLKTAENQNNQSKIKKETNSIKQFLKGGYLAGYIAKSFVVIDLNNATGSNNEVNATEFYPIYPKQKLEVVIKKNGNDSYTINESYKGKATGIYTLTMEGNVVSGNFENVSTGVISNVKLEFTNDYKEIQENVINVPAGQNTSKVNASNIKAESGHPTIGFFENIVNTKIVNNGEKMQVLTGMTNDEFRKCIHQYQNTGIVPPSLKGKVVVSADGQNYTGDHVNSFEPASTKVGAADFEINGEKCWNVTIVSTEAEAQGANAFYTAVISQSGKTFNNEEIYNAAKNGNVKYYNPETGGYDVEQASIFISAFQKSNSVVTESGDCNGMLTSADNQDSAKWKTAQA